MTDPGGGARGRGGRHGVDLLGLCCELGESPAAGAIPWSAGVR